MTTITILHVPLSRSGRTRVFCASDGSIVEDKSCRVHNDINK